MTYATDIGYVLSKKAIVVEVVQSFIKNPELMCRTPILYMPESSIIKLI